jgi:antitoxin component YwqK of YwqJK toxin-antitoxin module
LFEGEYKNFEKYNGKLIEYFDDINHIVKRVIEIKEGNKTGKGKEYYGNEKLKYIGTYVDGKRDGKGKEFYEFFGYIKYEGEFKNDERHGFGKEYDKQGNLLYEGEYSFGKRKEN